jgi:hypothetical protein
MPAKPIAVTPRTRRLEACQFAQLGILPVSTDQPAARNNAAFHQQTFRRQTSYAAAPMQQNPAFGGAIHHPLMQDRTPNAVTNAAEKTGPNFLETVDKPDASKRRSISGINANAQCRQRSQAVRHYAFSAGLIDGWLRTVDDRNVETGLPCSNCRRKSRRTSTRDQNFCFSKVAHVHQRSKTSSEQNPGPIAARML